MKTQSASSGTTRRQPGFVKLSCHNSCLFITTSSKGGETTTSGLLQKQLPPIGKANEYSRFIWSWDHRTVRFLTRKKKRNNENNFKICSHQGASILKCRRSFQEPIHSNFKIPDYHPPYPSPSKHTHTNTHTHTHTPVTYHSLPLSFTSLFTLKASRYSCQIIPAEI